MKALVQTISAISTQTFASLASAGGSQGITVTWEAIDAGIPSMGSWGLIAMAPWA